MLRAAHYKPDAVDLPTASKSPPKHRSGGILDLALTAADKYALSLLPTALKGTGLAGNDALATDYRGAHNYPTNGIPPAFKMQRGAGNSMMQTLPAQSFGGALQQSPVDGRVATSWDASLKEILAALEPDNRTLKPAKLRDYKYPNQNHGMPTNVVIPAQRRELDEALVTLPGGTRRGKGFVPPYTSALKGFSRQGRRPEVQSVDVQYDLVPGVKLAWAGPASGSYSTTGFGGSPKKYTSQLVGRVSPHYSGTSAQQAPVGASAASQEPVHLPEIAPGAHGHGPAHAHQHGSFRGSSYVPPSFQTWTHAAGPAGAASHSTHPRRALPYVSSNAPSLAKPLAVQYHPVLRSTSLGLGSGPGLQAQPSGSSPGWGSRSTQQRPATDQGGAHYLGVGSLPTEATGLGTKAAYGTQPYRLPQTPPEMAAEVSRLRYAQELDGVINGVRSDLMQAASPRQEAPAKSKFLQMYEDPNRPLTKLNPKQLLGEMLPSPYQQQLRRHRPSGLATDKRSSGAGGPPSSVSPSSNGGVGRSPMYERRLKPLPSATRGDGEASADGMEADALQNMHLQPPELPGSSVASGEQGAGTDSARQSALLGAETDAVSSRGSTPRSSQLEREDTAAMEAESEGTSDGAGVGFDAAGEEAAGSEQGCQGPAALTTEGDELTERAPAGDAEPKDELPASAQCPGQSVDGEADIDPAVSATNPTQTSQQELERDVEPEPEGTETAAMQEPGTQDTQAQPSGLPAADDSTIPSEPGPAEGVAPQPAEEAGETTQVTCQALAPEPQGDAALVAASEEAGEALGAPEAEAGLPAEEQVEADAALDAGGDSRKEEEAPRPSSAQQDADVAAPEAGAVSASEPGTALGMVDSDVSVEAGAPTEGTATERRPSAGASGNVDRLAAVPDSQAPSGEEAAAADEAAPLSGAAAEACAEPEAGQPPLERVDLSPAVDAAEEATKLEGKDLLSEDAEEAVMSDTAAESTVLAASPADAVADGIAAAEADAAAAAPAVETDAAAAEPAVEGPSSPAVEVEAYDAAAEALAPQAKADKVATSDADAAVAEPAVEAEAGDTDKVAASEVDVEPVQPAPAEATTTVEPEATDAPLEASDAVVAQDDAGTAPAVVGEAAFEEATDAVRIPEAEAEAAVPEISYSLPPGVTVEMAEASVLCIQTRARGYLARRQVATLRKDREAAKEAPAAPPSDSPEQGKAAYGLPPGITPEMAEAAAVRIQSHARGYLARRQVAELRQAGQAALATAVSAAAMRKLKSFELPPGVTLEMAEAAAIRVQAHVRGHLDRRRVQHMRNRRAVAAAAEAGGSGGEGPVPLDDGETTLREAGEAASAAKGAEEPPQATVPGEAAEEAVQEMTIDALKAALADDDNDDDGVQDVGAADIAPEDTAAPEVDAPAPIDLSDPAAVAAASAASAAAFKTASKIFSDAVDGVSDTTAPVDQAAAEASMARLAATSGRTSAMFQGAGAELRYSDDEASALELMDNLDGLLQGDDEAAAAAAAVAAATAPADGELVSISADGVSEPQALSACSGAAVANPMDVQEPGGVRVLAGKYEVQHVVGEGAYGMVMKCKVRGTEPMQWVAIKEFKIDDNDPDAEDVKRTSLREVSVLEALQHAHVVGFVDKFMVGDRLFIVMEFLPCNLLELLEAQPGGMDRDAVRLIMFQLCSAIAFIHTKGMIYRDIKPENLLVDEHGTVKLCDFGFARYVPSGPSSHLTDYVATRWYRAPELLLGPPYRDSTGKHIQYMYGSQVDMWAVGCLMGELLDGEPLFAGDSDLDQLYRVQQILGPMAPGHQYMFYANPHNTGIVFNIKQPLTLAARYRGKVSDVELSFMQGLLEMDPGKRLTGEQCLQHPYLVDLAVAAHALPTPSPTISSTPTATVSLDGGSVGAPAAELPVLAPDQPGEASGSGEALSQSALTQPSPVPGESRRGSEALGSRGIEKAGSLTRAAGSLTRGGRSLSRGSVSPVLMQTLSSSPAPGSGSVRAGSILRTGENGQVVIVEGVEEGEDEPAPGVLSVKSVSALAELAVVSEIEPADQP